MSKRPVPPLRLAEMQGAGFPMGAEPLVALDLVDTIITVADPPIDLIADPAQASKWWHLQAGRLPDGPPPTLRRLAGCAPRYATSSTAAWKAASRGRLRSKTSTPPLPRLR